MLNSKINLEALTKNDLINVIAEMHDIIQEWNNGWGLNEKDGETLIHIGNLCVADSIKRNGREKIVLPNIEQYNGAKIVEDIIPYISSKEKGKFAQDCSNIYDDSANSANNIISILKLANWRNNFGVWINPDKTQNASYCEGTEYFVIENK